MFVYVAGPRHGEGERCRRPGLSAFHRRARLDDLGQGAYGLQELYDNLGKTGARTTMLLLEANLAENLDELINPPESSPSLRWRRCRRTRSRDRRAEASDRDQRAIQDPESASASSPATPSKASLARPTRPRSAMTTSASIPSNSTSIPPTWCARRRENPSASSRSRCSPRSTIWWWGNWRRIRALRKASIRQPL